MDTLQIEDERGRVVIVPALGAGLASYDVCHVGVWKPLLRSVVVDTNLTPLDLASFLLAPWVNRISNGGFEFRGIRINLEPNLPGQALPIHGNALSAAWQVDSVGPDYARLQLRSEGPAMFNYAANVEYRLTAGNLKTTLAIEHQGTKPLPYGMGFHPWFVRTPKMQLIAQAGTVCLMDDELLPRQWISVVDIPEWDFRKPRALPEGLIDNPFSDWDGKASLIWEDRDLVVDMTVTPNLGNHCQIYSPGPASNFVCFEPVSHNVNEHNLSASVPQPGLVVLEQGECVEGSMDLCWRALVSS